MSCTAASAPAVVLTVVMMMEMMATAVIVVAMLLATFSMGVCFLQASIVRFVKILVRMDVRLAIGFQAH